MTTGELAMPTCYDDKFMDYTARCALISAQFVVPCVVAALGPVASVCDFGCARGAWLSVWRTAGVEIFGVDGDYVDANQLLIPVDRFQPCNLASPVRLGRRFDLVQCLEVAEHLPEVAARTLVRSLAAHADRILFSAAPPGQGGLGHVNERSYEYWQGIFAEHGFAMFDCLRQKLAGAKQVMPWYRYNTFLFVRGAAIKGLSQEVRDTEIPAGASVPDISPLAWRLRRRMVCLLPLRARDSLARVVGG